MQAVDDLVRDGLLLLAAAVPAEDAAVVSDSDAECPPRVLARAASAVMQSSFQDSLFSSVSVSIKIASCQMAALLLE